MGCWTDIATWRGPTANQGGMMSGHRGVVLHIAEGTFEGTVAWCTNAGSRVSAHFVIAKSGEIAQLVDTDIQSWCQAAGNSEWLSIEHEGHGGEKLTTAQVEACARVVAKSHQVYGIPLVATGAPDGRGLGHHSMGGYAWGDHLLCPGGAIVAQKPEILAVAQRIVGMASAREEEEEEDDVRSLMRYRDAPHVFLSDGVFARWVTSEGEIVDLRTLSSEGTIRLGYNGKIRVVSRRELVGRIIGRVPAGWEDLAA